MNCALVVTRGVVLHLWNVAEVAGQKLKVLCLFSNWSPSPSPKPLPFQGEGRFSRPFGERIKERGKYLLLKPHSLFLQAYEMLLANDQMVEHIYAQQLARGHYFPGNLYVILTGGRVS